jgi:cbb3-type cytochrome oxidase subunit 1
MEWFVRAFLKAGLVWLALGITSGLAMAMHPVWTVYRPAHVHMVLLGFVTMMICGVAYHVIPRFVGFPLHNRRAAGVHWWLANTGLAMMVCGFIVRATNPGPGTVVLSVGGTLAATGAYIFVYLIWRTVDGPVATRKAAKRAREATTSSSAARLPII